MLNITRKDDFIFAPLIFVLYFPLQANGVADNPPPRTAMQIKTTKPKI
jgi:hypothetical protein